MAKKHAAQCAYGAVRFEFNTDPTFVAACSRATIFALH